jgi:hypothetical protein
MKWTTYLNRRVAFKPFRPHPPAAGPCDVGAARSGVAGVSSPFEPTRGELRERLQALEAWKQDAGLELPIIEDLIWHYRDALGLTEIPTSMHDPDYWKEKREELGRTP